ncbi:MAG TPA: serine/threonine-protein kinase [Kofleriaceae bacterium]
MSRALGRYELLRPLARGGMGEVYLARRRAAGVEKWLVVKRMRPERAGDARFLDLFMREARLSMSLAHQNIVPVFDFGRIDDQVFLAMERVEGKDLGSSITKAGKGMPPLLAAFIAAECCQALDYAHRRKGPDGTDLGIVHRDVTPRNVLLSWSGEVKLTDFGIAALAGDQPSKMAGTPAYMAPEQARSETTDVRADIYAVGMVLREALTGERGRRGNDRETVLAAAQAGNLDPWPPGFESDSPVRAIVDRATQSDKEARYPDARAMLEELDNFIVAERAAKKSEAPARLVAAWLADVWQGERDDVTISDVDIEAKHLMSFLDDGMFDVVGTGTQRSMAMTAAEEIAKPEAAPSSISSHAGVSVPPGQVSVAPVVDSAPPQRRSQLPWILLGAVLVAGATAALVLSIQGKREPERPPAQPIVAVTADAAPVEPLVADAVVVAPPPTPADAAPADASTRTKPRITNHPIEKANPQPAIATKYKVVINSKPRWSYFTIDNDPTKYATVANLELTPGPHKLHFTGNEAFPADKIVNIVVPDKDGFKIVVPLDAPAP